MNAIMGFAQLLEMEALPDDQREMVRMIHESGSNLLHIIEDLLDLSKIEAGKLRIDNQPFGLSSMLERFDCTFRKLAQDKDLGFSVQIPLTDLGSLLGDVHRLEQILNNLTSNAIKFTERGEVTVSVSAEPINNHALRLRFEVKDTGIGIAPNVLQNLFQPFAQGDSSISRRFGGTGLGLVISKRIAEAMGGQLGVVSEADQGSTFWVEIPFERVVNSAADKTPSTDSSPSEAEKPILSGMHVLAVDDDASNLALIEQTLQRQGANVTLAIHGQEALDTLRAGAGHYDMVLMDIRMPVMDGLAATREIRKDAQLAHVPVIALTAGALPEEREAALSAGVNDFMTKPFDLQQIKTVLSKYRDNRSPMG